MTALLATLLLTAAPAAAQVRVAAVPVRGVVPPALTSLPVPALGVCGAAASAPMPTAVAVLVRLDELGIPRARVAEEISASRSLEDAAARLGALGALPEGLDARDELSRLRLETVLRRLWGEVARERPDPLPVDASWPVPALVVARPEATYFVHGVAHGQYRPAGRRALLSLVRRLQERGAALYSEQNLPRYYGYAYGRESLDHAAHDGLPAPLVSASLGRSPLRDAARRLLDPVAGAAAAAWAAAALWADPFQLAAWLVLAALGGTAWLYATSGLPGMRRRHLSLARLARARGDEDLAALRDAEADAWFTPRPDLAEIGRLELPQPLGASADPLSVRSRAMADAARLDAELTGAKEVHLVVGVQHAHEAAWRLAHPGPR